MVSSDLASWILEVRELIVVSRDDLPFVAVIYYLEGLKSTKHFLAPEDCF